ncbi:MAG: TIGR00730 family Rossman fold protein, partial [Pseudomonadota bacterium]
MKRVCVFCGSSMGSRPVYAEAARALGRMLAGRGIGLVYGGGNIGLMGEVANAALAGGAEVIGVIPEALMKFEVGNLDLTALHVVGSMHERKALMAELSAGVVALPGGMGTMVEL